MLTLDEAEHLRQRKLLLPPFHGERVSSYGELIREITERDVESWPIGEPFALRPHTQQITLAVILRAVFGIRDEERFERAAALVGQFARRADLITQAPVAATRPRALQPLVALPARPRRPRRVHL